MLKNTLAFMICVCIVFCLCACEQTGDRFKSAEEMQKIINGVWEIEGSIFIFNGTEVSRLDKDECKKSIRDFINGKTSSEISTTTFEDFQKSVNTYIKKDSSISFDYNKGVADWDGWRFIVKDGKVSVKDGDSNLNFKKLSDNTYYAPDEFKPYFEEQKKYYISLYELKERVPLCEEVFALYNKIYKVENVKKGNGIEFTTLETRVKITPNEDNRAVKVEAESKSYESFQLATQNDVRYLVHLVLIYTNLLTEKEYTLAEVGDAIDSSKQKSYGDLYVKTVEIDHMKWEFSIKCEVENKKPLWKEIISAEIIQ